MTELCAPWVDSLEPCPDLPDDPDPGLVNDALLAASEMLFAASGRRFRGVCTDTVHPCMSGCSPQWLAYPDGTSRPLPTSDCSCPTTAEGLWCSGRWHAAVPLPNTPVVDIVEVVVDGAALPADATVLVDDRWLLRTSGTWPVCQDLTDPDRWRISYRWGAPVPASGRVAARLLACDLLKGWLGGPCRIPRRVTQMTREGVSWTMLDPMEDLLWQGFGIAEVAAFVQATNPHRQSRPARFLSPRAATTRRVRP